MKPAAGKPMRVTSGFQYRHPTGKQWPVTHILPGSVCEVSQVGGLVWHERYARNIRAPAADDTAIPTDTTDEAAAIIRRCA